MTGKKVINTVFDMKAPVISLNKVSHIKLQDTGESKENMIVNEESSSLLLPKVRPFDSATQSSKHKKPTSVTSYLQNGKMLKYLETLMTALPESTKQMLVMSDNNEVQHKAQPVDDCDNIFTAVDTLNYAEVARHLITLRTEHVQRFIRPVLQRLLIHPRNVTNLFNKAVDPVALELHDYFARVKKPMDLGTVKSKLQRGYYKNIGSVTADIDLVFKNALGYNASSHAIHQIAKIMKGDFHVDMLALEDKCAREVYEGCTSNHDFNVY
jgi:hypothetical protein